MGVRRAVVLGGLIALVMAGLVVFPAEASVTAAERRCGNTTQRVQLTFDDAADPARVHALLDVLADRGVRAGFFAVGGWAAKNPAVMARIRSDGHWLGNHSASHADLAGLADAGIRREIAGGVAGDLLRPPYGSVNGRVRAVAASAGYRLCLWDIDTWDWRGRSAEDIRRSVFSGLQPGAVVLLHLQARHTLEALPSLIDGIRSRGYELDPLTRFSAGAIDPATSSPLLLQRDGEVLGGPDGHQRVAAAPVPEGDAAALAVRPAGLPGQWVATRPGGVHAVGGAPFFGADGPLNAPLVAITSTPSGAGYWTAGSDGGVFAHGDAGFFGSTGGMSLNQAVVALAPTPSGRGYWLLARDGGVFAFGDAAFLGSVPGSAEVPFVAMAVRPQGDGYWLLRHDGAVAAFGAAPDHGGFETPPDDGNGRRSFLAIAADADGAGYRLVADRPGESYSFR